MVPTIASFDAACCLCCCCCCAHACQIWRIMSNAVPQLHICWWVQRGEHLFGKTNYFIISERHHVLNAPVGQCTWHLLMLLLCRSLLCHTIPVTGILISFLCPTMPVTSYQLSSSHVQWVSAFAEPEARFRFSHSFFESSGSLTSVKDTEHSPHVCCYLFSSAHAMCAWAHLARKQQVWVIVLWH